MYRSARGHRTRSAFAEYPRPKASVDEPDSLSCNLNRDECQEYRLDISDNSIGRRQRRIWWLADEFVHFCDNSRSTCDSMVRSHGEKHRRLTNLQLGAYRGMTAPIISLFNHKGGVSKTTTAFKLGRDDFAASFHGLAQTIATIAGI